MADPLVTLLIPCYNQARFLEEAAQSCLAQTYGNIELIIVNDGSPDDSLAVAETIRARNPERSITVIDQKNQGLAQTRNNAVAASSGEYILPLDSDDAFDPLMVETCVTMLEADPGLGIAYTNCLYFGTKEYVPDWIKPWDAKGVCMKNILCYASMYRRTLFDDIGGYRTDMIWGYEDWEFWVRAARHGWSGKLHEEPLFLHRLHGPTMYSDAYARDAELKARMVAGNRDSYNEKTQRTAAAILNGTTPPPPPGEFVLEAA